MMDTPGVGPSSLLRPDWVAWNREPNRVFFFFLPGTTSYSDFRVGFISAVPVYTSSKRVTALLL